MVATSNTDVAVATDVAVKELLLSRLVSRLDATGFTLTAGNGDAIIQYSNSGTHY